MPPTDTSLRRLTFFISGFALAAAALALRDKWLYVANDILGMSVIFVTRPLWLRVAMGVLEWAPGLAIAALIVARWRIGPSVRPLAFAGGVVSLYAGLIALVLFGPVVADHWHRQRFDAVEWKAAEDVRERWTTRLTMVDDLRERHLRTGMPRSRVEMLIGPPDSTEYFRNWDMVYYLGPERGIFGIDSEWLVVDIDERGRVADHQLVTD